MSAKTMTSLADENRDIRKKIGCLNGLFQIFNRHHFITGRRISSYSNTRVLRGPQHQQDQQYAMKAVTAKSEKPRTSAESSRPSFSSASCSSTFSSVEHTRTDRPETLSPRESKTRKSQCRITSTKERHQSTKSMQSNDIRDIVKESMYREVRSLSIKFITEEERRGTVMKQIDSPRPSQQPKTGKPKPTGGYTGSPRAPAKSQDGTKNTKKERLGLPRYSYDGRESRDVKHKELPRLSVDSKTGSMKAIESRLSFLDRAAHVETNTSSQVVPLNQETEGYNRTSNVIAKLMGLNSFSHTILTDKSMTQSIRSCSKEAFLSQSTTTLEGSKRNQVRCPTSLLGNNAASLSPKMHSAKKKKTPTKTRDLTSSEYGEIEKRITEIEFKKSSKDQQILEAMQRTTERLEDERGQPAEFTLQRRCIEKHNRKTYQQVPTIKGPGTPTQSGYAMIAKQAKVMDKVKRSVARRGPTAETSHLDLQSIKTHSLKYKQGSSTSRKANNLISENDNVKHHPSTNKKTSWNTSEQPSPRSRQKLHRIEGQYRPTTPASDSGWLKKQCSKKVIEKDSQYRKNKVKGKDQQLSDDQPSEHSSDTRYSSYQGDTASVKSEGNNSLALQTETVIISVASSINAGTWQKENSVSTTGEHMRAVESAQTMLEQPSPISVLDNSFYCDDTPSPVKKISTGFRDESTSRDEAEWHPKTLNHLKDCTRFDDSFNYNQKLEDMINSLTLLNNELDGTTADRNGTIKPDHRYIDEILLTSGILKNSSFIPTDHLLSSNHLINPEMFHVLEQTEDIKGGAIEKNNGKNFNNRIQRKITFDIVDEILVRKVNSGRLFTAENEQMSPHKLLKEVYLGMNSFCMTPDCNPSEKDDTRGLMRIDVTFQSKNWVSYNGEVPALVLDIERLLFKDLISEVATGEVMDL